MNVNRFAIVTSFDAIYMNYSKVMVQTLCENYHGKTKLNLFCLVPDSLLEKQTEYINSFSCDNINIKFVSSDKFNKADYFVEREQYTKNAWHRIFVGSLFPNLDKILYLDPDIIIMRDIAPVLEYKTWMPIAAYIEDDFQEHCLEVYDNQDMIYFSDGVFIADLNAWREKEFEKKLIQYAKTHNTKFVDQDAINFVMREHVQPLPVTFNFFVDKAELYWTVKDPLIVHFSGPVKPWKEDMLDNKFVDAWRKKYKLLMS